MQAPSERVLMLKSCLLMSRAGELLKLGVDAAQLWGQPVSVEWRCSGEVSSSAIETKELP